MAPLEPWQKVLVDGENFPTSGHGNIGCITCHGGVQAADKDSAHTGMQRDPSADPQARCGKCHTNVVAHAGTSLHATLQGFWTTLETRSMPSTHDQVELAMKTHCARCHTGPAGSDIPPANHRYEGIQTPRCETCHALVSSGQDEIVMHQMHGGNLSCQVCHSVSYTSCDGCHVALGETTGKPFFETKASYFTFLIGRNPIKSYERPYQYVPVRHVPIDQDSFAFYGNDVLPRFDVLETWKYATPHNIQRRTPQTESCNACHGNKALFLTADKAAPAELLANQAVIVEGIPLPITSADQIP